MKGVRAIIIWGRSHLAYYRVVTAAKLFFFSSGLIFWDAAAGQSSVNIQDTIDTSLERLSRSNVPSERFRLYEHVAASFDQQGLEDSAHVYHERAYQEVVDITDRDIQLRAYLSLIRSSYPKVKDVFLTASGSYRRTSDMNRLVSALHSHYSEYGPEGALMQLVDSLEQMISVIPDGHDKAIHHYYLSLFYDYGEMLKKLHHLAKAEALVDTTRESSIDILVDLGVLYDELEIWAEGLRYR